MKIAICEDEKICSDLLIGELDGYFKNIGEQLEFSVFTDGQPLLEAYRSGGRFDISFLDIQLESSDGVETASEIRRIDGEAALIFVTGINDRAVEGYAVSAFDYIVKQTMKERLPGVLDRFMRERGRKLLTVTDENGQTELLRLSDILYAESSGRGTLLHTEKRSIKSAAPIGKVAASLPPDLFTETHKSVYVRVDAIKRVDSDTVEMSNGGSLPLSRRRRKEVMSAIMRAVRGRLQ